MNALIRLWNVILGLAESLERTKEIVDAGNARAEQSLGLDRPQLKLLDVSASAGSDASPVDRQDAPAGPTDDGKKRRQTKAVA